MVAGPNDMTAALLIRFDSGLNARWAQAAHFGAYYAAEGLRTEFYDVVVQYDNATGAALWARAAIGGGGASYFYGIAADGAGNVTAAGYQHGTNPFTYGGRVTATGTNTSNNAVVVGYR